MSDAPVTPIHWEIHDTHPELVEPLRAKLAEMVDPEIALNVIQLGLIRKVSIVDKEAKHVCFADHAVLPLWPGHAGNDQAKSHGSLEYAGQPGTGHGDVGLFLMEDPGALDWGMYT